MVSQQSHRFSKAERLSSRKLIDTLFKEGAFFKEYPLKFLWLPINVPGSYPAQLCTSVPKRKVAKATDRNYIKRLMRESYRHHKGLLYRYLRDNNAQIAIMVIYIGHTEVDHEVIETAMNKGLKQLTKEYEKHQQNR